MNGKQWTYTLVLIILLVAIIGIFFFSDAANYLAGVNEPIIAEGALDFTAPTPNLDQDPLNALIFAEKEIETMREAGFGLHFVNDTLLVAQRAYGGPFVRDVRAEITTETLESRINYLEKVAEIIERTPPHEIERLDRVKTIEQTTLITFRKEQAFVIFDNINILDQRIEEERRKGDINLSEADFFFNKGVTSFEEERYEESIQHLKQTEIELKKAKRESLRLRNLALRSRNFLLQYWWQILIVLLGIALFMLVFYRRIKRWRAKRKLEKMLDEREILKRLLIKAQTDCFKRNIISVGTYNIRADRYKKRMREIDYLVPVYTAISKGEEPPKKKKRKEALRLK